MIERPVEGVGRPRVLCVDDEPQVLSALRRVLSGSFDVDVEEGGVAALGRLATNPGYAVVLSDLRMPVVDGVTLLRRARDLQPDAARILLTGHADVEAAVRSVNEAGLHSFLTKPCPSDVLVPALEKAVDAHRQLGQERDVLEQTLAGAVRTLIDLLALANPYAYARAERITRESLALLAMNGLAQRWELEVAAMLSQIGSVSLPHELLDRLHHGRATSAADVLLLRQVPTRGADMLSNIPRLEGVADAIRHQLADFDGGGEPGAIQGYDLPLASRVLRIAVDVDALRARGCTLEESVPVLLRRAGDYDPDLLAGMVARAGLVDDGVREVRVGELTPGLRLEVDVHDSEGELLIGRGVVLNDRLLGLLRSRLALGRSSDRVLVTAA